MGSRESGAPSEARPAPSSERVVALDGLRGLAVLLVLAAHANWPIVRFGGTVGVSVFFVLSGFLITTLLRREQATHGGIGLRRFYLRRALRLLPPLVVVLAAGVVLSVALGTDSAGTVLGAAAACLLYIANLYPWTHIDLGPFGHYWSLSLEEQFYVLWPAALLLAHRVRARALVVGLLVVAALSLGARFAGSWHDVDSFALAYYAPPGNVWALFVGCALALAIDDGWRPRIPPALLIGAVGLVLAASTVLGMRTGLRETAEPATYFLRLLAGPVGALGGLVLVAAAALGHPGVRWLEHRVLVWFGQISYGLYLWHGVIDDVTSARWGQTPARGVIVGTVAALVSIGVAVASHRWVEAPALRLKARYAVPGRPADASAPAGVS